MQAWTMSSLNQSHYGLAVSSSVVQASYAHMLAIDHWHHVSILGFPVEGMVRGSSFRCGRFEQLVAHPVVWVQF
jgi:hypothetical protein